MRNQTLHDICDPRRTVIGGTQLLDTSSPHTCIGLVLIHASWNKRNAGYHLEEQVLSNLIREATKGCQDCQAFAGCVQVDETDESLALCLGDGNSDEHDQFKLPSPPAELPALAIVAQTSSMEHAVWSYVPKLHSRDLICALQDPLFDTSAISSAVNRTVEEIILLMSSKIGIGSSIGSSDKGSESAGIFSAYSGSSALRIFVAGDRSSVGKSSVCLGILGSLLNTGYAASELAYIKPATQSESTQLIEVYCKQQGIACVPIGPLVYYRGFTRAFLAGETATTEQLLTDCGLAVDEVAKGKKVVLVDGVGFPAVGSICGTDNASVSRACGYPAGVDSNSSRSLGSKNSSSGGYERKPMGVVLVGGSGVGGAVDAFNLNATYFEMKHVPVLGAIFNKLSTEEGFYSLENCKQQVTAYFDQDAHHQAKGRRPFGFVPLVPEIAGPNGMDHVQEYFRIFGSHVDVKGIIEAATRVKENVDPMLAYPSKYDHSPVKPRRMISVNVPLSARNRTEIEAAAIDAGAAPST